jgi:CHAT domain-containing protein
VVSAAGYFAARRSLRSAGPNKHDEELARIRQFFGKENLQVIHLACHAPRGADDEPCLLVSNQFAITLEELEGLEFRVRSHALIILNACLTGTINPLSTMSNWAIFFKRKGAKGVVATEFEVPDWFAAEFITEVYKYLLQGKTIGEAMLVARQQFLEQGNPLGLAYSLYAPPSLRIVEPQHAAPLPLNVTRPAITNPKFKAVVKGD